VKRRPSAVAAVDASSSHSTPAPVGGWNARDSLARMRSDEAIVLDNWFPQATDAVVRPGSNTFATGGVGEVIRSLMGVSKFDGTFKRFFATENGIFDFTAGGAVGAVSSAATTGIWQHVQINVGDISYLWCCAGDGVNKSRIYNSTAGTWTLLDGGSAPVLTGPTSADIANVSLFKNRLILTQRNSLKFWYGPLNSVGGVFSAFDLGAVFKRGGYLVATANWTIDAGDGPDDRFVAISSEGEVAVYQGTDPSLADAFALVGVYFVGKPTGRRCFVSMAGDLGILTEQGLWPISKALQSATIDRRVALTDRIQSAFNTYYKTYGALQGWEAQVLPKGPAILVNVPFSGASYQFVMNTITGAWCRFTGWSATCMMVLDGVLYFAFGSTVKEGWVGDSDDTSGIAAFAKTAYTSGGLRNRGKKVNLVQPIMTTTAPIQLGLAIDVDLQANINVPPATTSVSLVSALWDTAIYDVDFWAGGAVQIKKWHSVRNVPNNTFSLRLSVTVNGVEVSWSATNYIFEAGGLMV
jgi:hypothetical protein